MGAEESSAFNNNDEWPYDWLWIDENDNYHDENYDTNDNSIYSQIEAPRMINLDNNGLPNQKSSVSQKQLFRVNARSPRRIVVFTDDMIALKNGFYSIFTTKKVFQKCYIVLIHNTILVQSFGFEKMKRDEYRCLSVYFQNYAHKKDQILECLRQNKDLILRTILKDLPPQKKKI